MAIRSYSGITLILDIALISGLEGEAPSEPCKPRRPVQKGSALLRLSGLPAKGLKALTFRAQNRCLGRRMTLHSGKVAACRSIWRSLKPRRWYCMNRHEDTCLSWQSSDGHP